MARLAKLEGKAKTKSPDVVYFDEEWFSDNDSEEEMLDESDDGGYNDYDGCDRGYYYYSDGRCERKVSPMMSPIISR